MLESLIQEHFRKGALGVRLPDGRLLLANAASEADASVIVALRDNETIARILRHPDLGFGEAYMDGGLVLERGALFDLLLLVMSNRTSVGAESGFMALMRRAFAAANSRVAARRNIAHHYDLSGELFSLFLDEDRQYSCAYFTDPGMTLDEAQVAKKRHIAAKLRLQPGQRVLDIGSGWGGLAITLAEEFDVNVVGVTLSTEQFVESRRRAAERGLRRNVHFELCDYRDVQGEFDRIVSVGMFEHVGHAHYHIFFDAIARLLKPDGVALLHTIGNTGPPTEISAWTDKYIFPGGHIPSLSEIAPAIEKAGLIMADIEVLRLHYAETLRAWRERFAANREKAKALYDERFCRMWEFYLAASEASFRVGRIIVYQIQLAKQVDALPLTRDYITDFDRSGRHAGLPIAAE